MDISSQFSISVTCLFGTGLVYACLKWADLNIWNSNVLLFAQENET